MGVISRAICACLLMLTCLVSESSATSFILAQKPGDRLAKSFAADSLGRDAAYTYCGSSGVVQIPPGLETMTPGTIPSGVTVIWSYGGTYRVLGAGLVTPRLGPASGPTSGGAIRIVDGVTFSLTAAGVQAAENDLPSGGGTVVIPDSTITVDAAISLSSGVAIVGIGRGPIFKRSASFLGINVFNTGGAAASGVRLTNITFDNGSLATTASDIVVSASSSDIEVDRCRWINLSGRASDLITVNSTGAAAQNRRIRIQLNRVIGGTTTSTYNSFQVFDASDVDISWNEIDGWGAIKYETSSALTTVARSINIGWNRFRNVDQTNIFARTNGSSFIDGVDVSHNTGTMSDITQNKGMVNIGEAVTSGGSTSNVACVGNVGRGFQKYFLNFGGGAGAGTVYGLTANGNAFDGRLEDSTNVQSTSESSLISLQNVYRYAITGNVGRYTGRSGIRGNASQGVISGNTLELCAQNSLSAPTPARESGIYLAYPSSDNIISDNVIYNSHNATLLASFATSGITLDKDGATTRTTIARNQIVDDRGASAGMQYGIKIGVSGATTNPDTTIVANNYISGATVGKWIKYGTGFYTVDDKTGVNFAALGTPDNGSNIFCTDCTKATPCAGGGSGAVAWRINGAWECNP